MTPYADVMTCYDEIRCDIDFPTHKRETECKQRL